MTTSREEVEGTTKSSTAAIVSGTSTEAPPTEASSSEPLEAPPREAAGGEDQSGGAGAKARGSEVRTELMDSSDSERFRAQWTEIQTTFVDEPRRAVESADALVAELMKRLAEGFAEERSRLEGQWDQGDDVSTEELRVALQRYRSFFNRLLTT